jgi:RNA polymerase sigma-70 factor (ECF subfamily)
MGDITRWLPAAKARQPVALGQVLEACRRYLLWIARKEMDPDLQPKAGASDLVQDTLLEAQRDIGHFQGETEGELLAWLRRLLLNNLSNFARSYRDTAKRRLDAEVPLDAGQADGPAATAPSPSDDLLAKEQLELILKARERLPADYRRVLTLWYEQERSFEEIGQAMNRSSNAARMLWMRAIERLQAELEALAEDS